MALERTVLLVCILVIFIGPIRTGNPSYEAQVTLTPKENAALQQFRKIINAKLPTKSKFVNKYAKDDLYLVRWLRAKNLDVKAAEKFFDDNLEWRIRENMDFIEDEDWTEMKQDFPIFTDGYDKDGRPVSEFWFPDWPTRSAVLAGKGKRIGRWMARLFEVTHRRLYDARAEGREVAETVFTIELDGFNVLQHACPGCLPIYFTLSSIYEEHYPGMYESINFMHIPPTFDIILRLIKPVLKGSTRNVMRSYRRKEDVLKWFDERMERDQRSVRYGGTVDREEWE